MRRPSAYLFAAVAVCACGSAVAEPARQKPSNADKLCDSYGPGFVPSGTPGSCVKVQERLRVEPQARRALSPFDGANAYAPMPSPNEGTLPAHLRLNGGYGGAGLR